MKFKTLFFISFVSTAVMIALMLFQGAPLKIPDLTPAGIINLEFARTIFNAAAIYDAWSPLLIKTAVNHIKMDFVFILSYSLLLFMVCYKITRVNTGKVKRIARWLCFAIVVAAFCDVFENILMLRILSGHISKEVVASTAFFASVKFVLLIVVIVFSAFCFLARLFVKKDNRMVSAA